MIRSVYKFNKNKLTELLSLCKLFEAFQPVLLIDDIVHMCGSPHILSKVDSAVLETKVHISFGLLRSTSRVREEVQMKFDAIEGIIRAEILRKLVHRVLLEELPASVQILLV